jgi:hypothetical protein
MAIDWTALDYSDPKALLDVLRPAYYRLVAGEAEEEIQGADHRKVRFSKADLPRLQGLIRQLEIDVARAAGGRRRFALTGRMHGRGGNYGGGVY